MDKKISVIICTHNRAKLLGEAIKSITSQSFSTEDYEIILVDNASTDSTRNIVENFQRQFKNIKYIYENNLGLSHARNRGIAESQAEIIAFLDDDARAEKGWLNEVKVSFENIKDLSALGGPVFLEWESGKRPTWLSKHLEYALSYQYYGEVETEVRHLNGCNLSLRKNDVISYGGFNVELGRKGNQMLAAEESNLILKMRLDGKKIIYNPNIIIYHYASLTKQKLSYFIRIYYGYGASDSIIYKSFSLKNCLKRTWLFPSKLLNIIGINSPLNVLQIFTIIVCETSKLTGFLVSQFSLLLKK